MLTIAALKGLHDSRCRRLLSGDGITTADFTINSLHGVMEGVSVDARATRKSNPAASEAFGIAKNLDEYQYRICTFVPSLADSDRKVQLQKCRVAIITAFAKLGSLIKTGSDLQDWNGHAKTLLVESSDLYVQSTSKATALAPKIGEALAFLGINEDDLDHELDFMYSIGTERTSMDL